MLPREFTHVWYWRNGAPRQRSALDRKGQPCRPLIKGSNGNLLIEFVDGYRTIAPRHAIRKAELPYCEMTIELPRGVGVDPIVDGKQVRLLPWPEPVREMRAKGAQDA